MLPFSGFLDNIKVKLHDVYRDPSTINPIAMNRGVPPLALSEIMALKPLSVSIPVEFGGRGGKTEEILSLLSAVSYESLALSLTIGINSGLFIQPVTKYAQEVIKAQIFDRFLKENNMGGLMITEPDHGSDALKMQTFFTEGAGKYHIQGTKHWAGLTGFADYWLLTAREKTSANELKRDISFFICDTHNPEQKIVVKELFDNLGLFNIPYGRNFIDVHIPESHRLLPHTSGINMLLDLLHRSRLQFPGMALGFIQRMMDEAITHCRQRIVGGKSLLLYDQVQQRLARLQAYFTIASAMCANSCRKAGIEFDLSQSNLEANATKTVITDMMQDAAHSLVQLVGAKSYRYNHIGGRGIIDSRPFQIFEGSNDILYTQIAENIIKLMKQEGKSNLFLFLNNFTLTKYTSALSREFLDFNLNMNISQRRLVELGRVVSRVITLEMLVNLGNNDFRQDLIDNAVNILRKDIAGFVGNLSFLDNSQVIEDYQSNSSWLSMK